MADNLQVVSATNQDPTTCVDSSCSCEIIWSLAQQFAMKHLVTHAPVHNHMPDYREGDPHVSSKQIERSVPEFVSNPEVRARRIAAAYARVFLEKFHLGNEEKVDRFYWLGLGAFASKQVAATLNLWGVKLGSRYSELRAGLGRGNLWLFNDVLAWFYAYSVDAKTFFECSKSRDSRKFVAQVATNFTRQKDFLEAIPYVPTKLESMQDFQSGNPGYLQCTQKVIDGFSKVLEWEAENEKINKADYAFKHLIFIAQHEQGEVLQNLIYNNSDFKKWLKLQRDALAISSNAAINSSINALQYSSSDGSEIAGPLLVRALVPSLHLVLTSDDETNNTEFRSDAPEGLILEDYQMRMRWIQDAAKKYHDLMQGARRETMIGYLTEITKWRDKTDGWL